MLRHTDETLNSCLLFALAGSLLLIPHVLVYSFLGASSMFAVALTHRARPAGEVSNGEASSG